MKKAILVILILLVSVGVLWAQEEATPRRIGSFSFLLGLSWTPVGLGFEFFAGPVGIGVVTYGIMLGTSEGIFYAVEPGAYVRFYFGDPSGALFASLGSTYTFAGGASGSGSFSTLGEGGLLKVNGGVGYNAFFGKKDNARFSVEVGPRYRTYVVEGSTAEALFPLVLHFQLMFGLAF